MNDVPEIHLGLNPTRRRTDTAKTWRNIGVTLAISKDSVTKDLGEFLIERLAGHNDPVQVTIRLDDYHAKLIYDAIAAKGWKGKVKA